MAADLAAWDVPLIKKLDQIRARYVQEIGRLLRGKLKVEEKDPGVATGKEENMLRLFGLHIETRE